VLLPRDDPATSDNVSGAGLGLMGADWPRVERVLRNSPSVTAQRSGDPSSRAAFSATSAATKS
jgi:hypothetical protein